MIMFIFLGIVSYLAIAVGFCLWDAFIGMPVDWDSDFDDNIPCWLAALLWPFAIPVVSLIAFSYFLNGVREKRAQREKKQQKLRIAAERAREKQEREEERLMAQIEAEIENETKGSHST